MCHHSQWKGSVGLEVSESCKCFLNKQIRNIFTQSPIFKGEVWMPLCHTVSRGSWTSLTLTVLKSIITVYPHTQRSLWLCVGVCKGLLSQLQDRSHTCLNSTSGPRPSVYVCVCVCARERERVFMWRSFFDVT